MHAAKNVIGDSFYIHDLTLIPTWIDNYIGYNVWYETTYQFLNSNGETIDVWEWICNFIPHFTGYVITYPCWDLKLIDAFKRLLAGLCLGMQKWLLEEKIIALGVSDTMI